MPTRLKGLLEIVKELKDLAFLQEVLADFELDTRQTKQLKYYCKIRLKAVQELATALKDSDSEEVENGIVNFWFELRSEWIRYNSVNNYNMMQFGKADELYMIQSSYISYLIDKIEAFIPPDKLEKIHEIMVKVQYAESNA